MGRWETHTRQPRKPKQRERKKEKAIYDGLQNVLLCRVILSASYYLFGFIFYCFLFNRKRGACIANVRHLEQTFTHGSTTRFSRRREFDLKFMDDDQHVAVFFSRRKSIWQCCLPILQLSKICVCVLDKNSWIFSYYLPLFRFGYLPTSVNKKRARAQKNHIFRMIPSCLARAALK